jgi:death-on-curing protein
MRYLTREQVLAIHAAVLTAHGGAGGMRDTGMLDAALAMPEATYEGNLLHPDAASAAAAYLFHLSQNHPFFDDNKRVAAMAAYVFLRANGCDLNLENDAFADLVLSVADGSLGKSRLTERLRAVVTNG